MSPRLEGRPLQLVQAVVRDGSRVLLTVRSDLWGWELPGGTVEGDERLEEALRREVLEETGLEVAVGRAVGDYERTGFRPHVARVFECRVVGGAPRRSRETLDVAWFEVDALPEELFPWYHQPLRDALAGGLPVVRQERQGLDRIWQAMQIDLRMRLNR